VGRVRGWGWYVAVEPPVPEMKVWDNIKPRNVSLALLNNHAEQTDNLIQRSWVKTNK